MWLPSRFARPPINQGSTQFFPDHSQGADGHKDGLSPRWCETVRSLLWYNEDIVKWLIERLENILERMMNNFENEGDYVDDR